MWYNSGTSTTDAAEPKNEDIELILKDILAEVDSGKAYEIFEKLNRIDGLQATHARDTEKLKIVILGLNVEMHKKLDRIEKLLEEMNHHPEELKRLRYEQGWNDCLEKVITHLRSLDVEVYSWALEDDLETWLLKISD